MAPDSPETQERVVTIKIGDISLRLRTSHSEKMVKALVQLVDDKIKAVLPTIKSGSSQNATLLACLNLAEELVLVKRETRLALEALQHHAKEILSELEGSQNSGPSRQTYSNECELIEPLNEQHNEPLNESVNQAVLSHFTLPSSERECGSHA